MSVTSAWTAAAWIVAVALLGTAILVANVAPPWVTATLASLAIPLGVATYAVLGRIHTGSWDPLDTWSSRY